MHDLKYPLVTVIIPTFKGSFRLKRAINSVLDQSYKNIELIIIDDNPIRSKERIFTENLLKNFKTDNRVKYIKHKKNLGGAHARNTGIAISKGKYICFLDDDDFYLKDKIKKQVNILNTYPVQAVSCLYIKNHILQKMKIKDNYTQDILTLKTTPTTPSLMIRSEVVKSLNGFDTTYARHQDYEFLLRFFRKNTIFVINEALIELDGGGNDNMLNSRDLENLKQKFFDDFGYIINEHNEKDKKFTKKIYASHYTEVFFTYLKEKNYKASVVLCLKIILKTKTYGVKAIFRKISIYIVSHIRIGHVAN